MSCRFFSMLVLLALGGVQFLVLPIFSNTSLGGKIAFFSLFTFLLSIFLFWKKGEWFLPKALVPLAGLAFVFILSLFLSKRFYLGAVELHTFVIGLVFCFLVANLSHETPLLLSRIFPWAQILGSLIAALCLFQYADWVIAGPRKEMLIPYLLPPGSARVNGVYGQSNLTALLLLVSIIAFVYNWVAKSNAGKRSWLHGTGLLLVSTAFFLTGSRAGFLALLVVAVLLYLLASRGKLEASLYSLTKPLLILAAGALISQLPFSSELATSAYTRSEISIDARFLFWCASFLMFLDAPILGVGLDHFKLYLPSYSREAHQSLGFVQYEAMGYTNWSHNEYLQILAESGIAGFICLVLFLILLLKVAYKEVIRSAPNNERAFLYVMVLPFFIQATFSWPFRHPALLFIFFLILGVILSKTSGHRFRLQPLGKIFIIALLTVSIPAMAFSSYKEYRFIQLKKEARENGCGSDEIVAYMSDPYLEFKMLREVLPVCLSAPSALKDRSLMEKLEPHFMKISELQGTHSQWYNFGLVSRSLGDYPQAEHAFQKAVERQPEFELGWSALHFLHMEEAARQTGRPIEEFFPPENNYSADIYDSIFQSQ